jgi:hypothetical protein
MGIQQLLASCAAGALALALQPEKGAAQPSPLKTEQAPYGAPASGKPPRDWPAPEPKPYQGYGFAYSLVGGSGRHFGDVLGVGGGGDGLLAKGLGVSVDLGYLFSRKCGCASKGIGLLTVNPSYHFVHRRNPGKVIPFFSAGYALAFRGGTANLYNGGGGITWWFSRPMGLRLEARGYYDLKGGHLFVMRTAVAFR